LYIVVAQLKIFTAEGTATRKLKTEKTSPRYIDWEDANMWCPHTMNPNTAIAIVENATNS
jgi:hypothetical protein